MGTLLVIASEGTLRVPQDLAMFTKGDNRVLVHHTKGLPFDHNKNIRVDAIALVYKLFKKDSLIAIKESLPYIDVSFFAGKCFILVTSAEQFCPGDTSEIKEFAQSLCLPIHFVSKSNQNLDQKDA